MPDGTSSNASTRRYNLLLVEPHFVTRRTVVSVAQTIDGIEVKESPGVDSAEQLLNFKAFDGFVIALNDQAEALDMIARIRRGQTPSAANASVAVTSEQCDVGTIEKLRELEVRRLLLKPFKVKTILETISAFSAGPANG
jgi:DNA-binding NarL/FixJ family response regulator